MFFGFRKIIIIWNKSFVVFLTEIMRTKEYEIFQQKVKNTVGFRLLGDH